MQFFGSVDNVFALLVRRFASFDLFKALTEIITCRQKIYVVFPHTQVWPYTLSSLPIFDFVPKMQKLARCRLVND